jgi:hypothetical protein
MGPVCVVVNTSNPHMNGPFVIQKFTSVMKDGKLYEGFDILLTHCPMKDIKKKGYKAKLVSENEILVQVPTASEDWKDGSMLAGFLRVENCGRFEETYTVERIKYSSTAAQREVEAAPPLVKFFRLYFAEYPGLFKGPFSTTGDDDAYISPLVAPCSSCVVAPDAHGRLVQHTMPYFTMKWRICAGEVKQACEMVHDVSGDGQLEAMLASE